MLSDVAYHALHVLKFLWDKKHAIWMWIWIHLYMYPIVHFQNLGLLIFRKFFWLKKCVDLILLLKWTVHFKSNSVWQMDCLFALKFWTKNRLFLRPKLSLKSKTKNQFTANRLFSLPWNYPNKWTVPLKIRMLEVETANEHDTIKEIRSDKAVKGTLVNWAFPSLQKINFSKRFWMSRRNTLWWDSWWS